MKLALATTLVAVFLLASAEKSPPRKALPPPCEVQCLEAKNAALQKLAVKRLKLASSFERERNGLKRVMRMRAARSVWNGLVCIHGFEGAWDDPNPPFWGGIQMDYAFQRTYGSTLLAHLGTADRWPFEAQLAVGIVAYYSGRGYGPWPNTRRDCGL